MIRIVYGPPASGKTTHIAMHRQSGDIVIDLDAIAVALGSPDSHDHPAVLNAVAGAARAAAIRRVIERDASAWVVDTWLRTQALRDLGTTAQWILIDPGEAVTLRRATRDRRPQASIDAIHKWYRDPPVPPCRTSQPAESNADLGQVLGDWW